MATFDHRGFFEFQILTAGGVKKANMHHHAKFCGDRSTVAEL